MSKKILVDWALEKEQEAQIRSIAEPAHWQVVFARSSAQALKEAADAAVIYGMNRDTVQNAPHLQWLCTQSAGVNVFTPPGVLPEGCLLTGSSGAYGVTISEHLVMVTLLLLRQFQAYQDVVAQDHWRHDIPVRSVRGSRITVLGTGDIGSNYARRIRSFDPARIVGVNRTGRRPSQDYDEIFRQDELERVLPETDVLVMSLPQTPETTGILSASRILLLPPQAVVINVGRGSSIDEAALIEALNAGRIAGAALDVMAHEPLPLDDPLRSARNVLLTPHSAGQMTLGFTKQKSVDLFCENLTHFLKGEPLERLVQREIGY